jgi:hypothetical protein
MPAREKLLAAAHRLHAYLLERHYHRGLLCGPDADVRWYGYLVGRIRFQQHEGGKAINYFDKPRGLHYGAGAGDGFAKL